MRNSSLPKSGVPYDPAELSKSLASSSAPASIKRLKSRAKALRKQSPELGQLEALNAVAAQRGFTKYSAASRASLRHTQASTAAFHAAHGSQFQMILQAKWSDSGVNRTGTETLRFALPRAWFSFLTSAQFRMTSAVKQFRKTDKVGASLEAKETYSRQDLALHYVRKAAYVLRFLECTGFRPAGESVLPRDAYGSRARVPALDHELCWYDEKTNACLLTNEPYMDSLERHRSAQNQWALEHGYAIVDVDALGMHNPGYPGEQARTCLQLIAPKALRGRLQELAANLKARELQLLRPDGETERVQPETAPTAKLKQRPPTDEEIKTMQAQMSPEALEFMRFQQYLQTPEGRAKYQPVQASVTTSWKNAKRV